MVIIFPFLQGSFHLIIDIYDNDDVFPATLNGDEFVDTVSVQMSLPLSTGYSPPTDYRGKYMRSVLSLSFLVTCAESYYGSDCGRFCRARDDYLGHYTCDDNGNIICNYGYRYPTANCTTECVPDSGCCELYIYKL